MLYDVALIAMCVGFWVLGYTLWHQTQTHVLEKPSMWHCLALLSWTASLMLFCFVIEWLLMAVPLFFLFTTIMLG
jgi:hypothetical protein